MNMKHIYIISIVVAFGFCSQVKAQDAHLSQYDASPILLNPALTGHIENGDFRIGALYRTQWGSISSSSFTSTGITFDTKLNARWGVGAYATNNDLAGFINAFNFMISGSYQISDPLQNKYKILTGLQAGVLYKRIDQQEFIFDSQYSNGGFNEDIPSGEVFSKNNLVVPDFNWGVAYVHTDKNSKIRPYVGASLFHINMPKESFTDASDSKLPIRWTFNGGSKFDVNPNLMIDVRSLFLLQRTAKEINFGALAYYKLNDNDYTLVCGVDVRWNDAVIINAGIMHKNIIYRMSYDYNTSSLNNSSNGRGGTELSIIYTPSKIRSAPSYN